MLVELRDLKIDLVVLDTDIKGFRQAMLDNDVAAVVTDFHSLKNVSDAQKLLAEQLIVDNIGVYLVKKKVLLDCFSLLLCNSSLG